MTDRNNVTGALSALQDAFEHFIKQVGIEIARPKRKMVPGDIDNGMRLASVIVYAAGRVQGKAFTYYTGNGFRPFFYTAKSAGVPNVCLFDIQGLGIYIVTDVDLQFESCPTCDETVYIDIGAFDLDSL